MTKELAKGASKDKAISNCIVDFCNSVTPLVRIDGVRLDITPFLEKEKQSYEQASERYRLAAERIGREMARRKKDPLVYP